MRRNFKVEQLQQGMTIVSKEPGNSMTPLIKSRQPVRLAPATWQDMKKDEIAYCKVKGNYYTHKVLATDPKKGVLIGNNHGHVNGWTKQVYGRVIEILKAV